MFIETFLLRVRLGKGSNVLNKLSPDLCSLKVVFFTMGAGLTPLEL